MGRTNIKRFYDQYFQQHGCSAYRRKEAYRPFLEFLSITEEDSILDIGCGTGHLLKLAEERGANAFGFDISEESVKLCREYVDGEVHQASAEEMPFEDDTFDYVTCIGVLEHSPSPAVFLEETRRVAKNSAEMLFIVPNKQFFLWMIKDEGTEQQDAFEQLRTFTEWWNLFEDNGMVVKEVVRDPWHKKFEGGKQALARVVNRLLPLRWNYQLMFLVEPQANGA